MYKSNRNIKRGIVKILFIFFNILFILQYSNPQLLSMEEKKETNETKKILYNNEKTEYQELQIVCKDNYYYYIFDLIDDDKGLDEIYQPIDSFIYSINHKNIKKIKKRILSIGYLAKMHSIFSKYRRKVTQLLYKEGAKIKQAVIKDQSSKRYIALGSLNREYKKILDKLNQELDRELIVKKLMKYIAKLKVPTEYLNYTPARRNIQNTEFNAIEYSLKPKLGATIKDRLLDLVQRNIKISDIWSAKYGSLGDSSRRIWKYKKKLSKSFLPSRIQKNSRKLEDSLNQWLSVVVQIKKDYTNYNSDLKNMKKILLETISSGKSKKGRFIDRINYLNDITKQLSIHIKKIRKKQLKKTQIDDVCLQVRALIDKKNSQVEEYYQNRKAFKDLQGKSKAWANEYYSIPGTLFKFPEVYDISKKKWKARN